MRVRVLVAAVLSTAVVLSIPAAAPAAGPAGDRDGRVTVDVQIKRFALADRRIVARGVLRSRIEGAGQAQAARKPVTLAVAAQAGRCHVLTLRLQDLQLELLGLKVDLSEVNLRLFAQRSGDGSGVLGRLFCTLSRSTIRVGRTRGSIALAKRTVRSLNSRLEHRPMRALSATARLGGGGPDTTVAQQVPSCRVLNLILGPLDLNLLGLVVELYGPSRNAPVTLVITSLPGRGVLGDTFCQLSGGPS
jgi:hypothetical protein